MRDEKIPTTPPRKGRFLGAEVSTKAIWTIFWSKQFLFFDHFFEWVEGRSLSGQTLPEWPP